ncbi:amino acid ABC transporter permease [Acidisoma silvae]|uniref:Amino acid ABC transporter permease n=1 Tax=Acidisoma silvae TaxID=2802396 RepID=A0A963YW98_9PROT|nr:amino acid ABC transporter permease [Acidisoma silvae]MCB8878141.1 amino acid ABC transporter permease [Acidisoma silvae]
MQFGVIIDAFPYLLQASIATIGYTASGIVVGAALAIVVCAARFANSILFQRAALAYVSFCRGVPLLVMLMLIFYLLPLIGILVPASVSAVLALGLCTSGYLAEMLRGSLTAIPRGQAEAAQAFGMTGIDTWRRVLLPQAIRTCLPQVIGEFIALMKASSLISVIGISELTRVSMNIAADTYRPLEAYIGAGIFYLAINLCLAGLGTLAERHFSRGIIA